MTVLRSDMVTPDRLAGLIADASWPDEALILAFTPARWEFCLLKNAGIDLGTTTEGRIFSAAGELRWRRIGDDYRAVYLGDGETAPPLAEAGEELAGLTPRSGRFLLWGVRSDREDEWLEQQIPHRFAYPVQGNEHNQGRVALTVEEWVDGNGFVRFSRYHSIREIAGESHAAES